PAVFQATGGNGADFSTGDEDQSYRSVALSETHLFSAKLVNEFRFGYNRIHSRRFQFNFNKDVSGQLGIPGVPFTPINGGMPEFDFETWIRSAIRPICLRWRFRTPTAIRIM